jgi:tetratricopeptide (TPR) repeat protein
MSWTSRLLRRSPPPPIRPSPGLEAGAAAIDESVDQGQALNPDFSDAAAAMAAHALIADRETERMPEDLGDSPSTSQSGHTSSPASALIHPELSSSDFESPSERELEPRIDERSSTSHQIRALAAEVERHAQDDELATAPTPVLDPRAAGFGDDHDELSDGFLQGFGTLGMAILTLLIFAGLGFWYWDSWATPASNPIQVAVSTGTDPSPNGNSRAPTVRGTLELKDPSEFEAAQNELGSNPEREAPKPAPIPDTGAKPGLSAQERAEEAYAALEKSLSAETGVVAEEGPFPGLELSASIGVTEEEPGVLDRIEALRAEGLQAYREQRWREALSIYQQVLKIKPQDLDANLRVGLVHYRLGELEVAERQLRATVTLSPRSAPAQNNLGLVLLARGQRDSARATFELAAQLQSADAFSNLAQLYASDGKAVTAAEHYRKALAINPEHGEARLGLALATLEEDEAKARAQFEKLLETPGVGPRAKAMLARLAYQRGDYAESQRLAESALAAEPGLIEARMNYALTLLAQDQGELADKQMRLVVAERPKDAEAWMNMGIVLMRRGQRDKAKQCLEYSLSLDKGSSMAHFNYARCAETFSNYLVALEEYERALDLDPFLWQAAYNLGLIYERGEKYEKSAARLRCQPEHQRCSRALPPEPRPLPLRLASLGRGRSGGAALPPSRAGQRPEARRSREVSRGLAAQAP